MNLPYDVFPLIFEHLHPASLCALAGVSTTFHEAIVPLLYRSIDIRKPEQLLETFGRCPERSALVKRIGVGIATSVGRRSRRGEYIEKVARVLRLCFNLESLSIPHDLAATALLHTGVLSALANLHNIELNLAALRGAPDNPASLLDPIFAAGRSIHSLQLYCPAASVLTRIPAWLDAMTSLTDLKLRDAYELQPPFFRTILCQTPSLRSLHLIRTLDAEVLPLLDLVPNLNSLGLTIRTSSEVAATLGQRDTGLSAHHPTPILARLGRLTLYLFSSDDPNALEPAFRSIMTFLSASPLQHVSIVADSTILSQISGSSPRFSASAIRALTVTHASSISRFTTTVPLSESGLADLLRVCTSLDYLNAKLPKNPEAIMGISASLRVLVIASDGRQISSVGVRGVTAMAKACPSLRKVTRGPIQWSIKVDGDIVLVEPCVQRAPHRQGRLR